MSNADVHPYAPDLTRRRLTQAAGAAGGLAIAGASAPFVASLAPSERARAQGAPVESDASGIAPGELTTVEWRGKPVWILRRTPDMLARLDSVLGELSDPRSEVSSQQPEYARNLTRSRRPELFVTVALCTHLGCVPSYRPEPGSLQPGWPGGFYCPCHGSKFDLAGRVFKGSPAPTNLVVPPHTFSSEDIVTIGADETTKVI
ncbi:MAG: ubiquinol-cytochrome c reductase iron-sulfur subunit [Betaproteobacteria bacterium]